jgi:hypothetical protein
LAPLNWTVFWPTKSIIFQCRMPLLVLRRIGIPASFSIFCGVAALV